MWHECKFRYDGYFEWIDEAADEIVLLLVECHGYQHYTFPNVFHRTLEQHEKRVKNDAIKKLVAQNAGYRYLVIREDEPPTEEHLRSRLEGVLGEGFWEGSVQA